MAQWERQRTIGGWGGRRQGAKNKTVIEKFFKKLNTTINVGNRKGLEQLAQPLVDEIATTIPGFNDYTEGLANSYAATVFSKRQAVRTVYHETGHRGVPHTGKKGGRWVALTTERHGLPGYEIINKGTLNEYKVRSRNARKSSRRRYLRKWEKMGGYRSVTTYGARKNGKKFGAYSALQGGGDSRAQNWLIIENKAPYADWVNRGIWNRLTHTRNRRYRVMPDAITRKIGPRATELIRVVTLKELKAAGFTVK